MILQIQGFPFDVPSPSHFCLILPAAHRGAVEVFFGGEGWLLLHEDNAGGVRVQEYPTRDLAIGVIAQAFRMEGL